MFYAGACRKAFFVGENSAFADAAQA
jgi:hypothetical protein